MNKFSIKLKELRQSSESSQKSVAESLNIALRSYQRYEEGSREPDINTLTALADYFQVSLDYLVGRSDNPDIKK